MKQPYRMNRILQPAITLFATGLLGLGPSGARIFEFVESSISKTLAFNW